MRAVNLLPPDTRGASTVSADLGAGPEAKGGAGPFVVLGILAAAVAGTAGYVLTENTIKQRSADLAEVTAAQQRLQSQANQLKPYADYDAMAKSRIQTVRDLATSRFDWEQALRDLSRAIPQDVTLQSLNGSTSGAGGTGVSVSSTIVGPAIAIAGCAPGQTQVARLMARLRDIDGVTRVSLSKAALTKTAQSGEVAGAASAAAPGGTSRQQRNAAPCGAGASSAFDMVMYFEKAAAAVAATPATATGAVAATPTPSATPTATPGTAANATSTTTTQQGTNP
jgi:Tfp pilus assembly protein PilN